MKKAFWCFVTAIFIVMFVLSCSCDTPNNPSGVSATAQSTSEILVSWNSVSGANSYEVYRSTSSYGTYSQVGTTTSKSYLTTGLTASTTYYYKVKAVNNCGMSDFSGYTSATTQSCIPTAPTGVKATTQSTTSINVSWNAVSNATSYEVHRATSSYYGTYSNIGTTTSISYIDNGLTASTTYYYKIKAANSCGTSSLSAAYNYATTKTCAVPSRPTGVDATAQSTTSIGISWNSVSDAISYEVHRSTSIYGTYYFLGKTTSTSYTDTGLSPKTTYYYKVKAVNNCGTSELVSYDYAIATTDK